MSNINLIIEERAADIGKFLVGRLLPFRQKRMIGPQLGVESAATELNLQLRTTIKKNLQFIGFNSSFLSAFPLQQNMLP